MLLALTPNSTKKKKLQVIGYELRYTLFKSFRSVLRLIKGSKSHLKLVKHLQIETVGCHELVLTASTQNAPKFLYISVK